MVHRSSLPDEGSPGASVLELMHEQVHRPAPALRSIRAELPAPFEAVVTRSLSKDREDRFPTAAAFTQALAGALAQARQASQRSRPSGRIPVGTVRPGADAGPSRAPVQPTIGARVPPWPSRRAALGGAMGLVALLVALVLVRRPAPESSALAVAKAAPRVEVTVRPQTPRRAKLAVRVLGAPVRELRYEVRQAGRAISSGSLPEGGIVSVAGLAPGRTCEVAVADAAGLKVAPPVPFTIPRPIALDMDLRPADTHAWLAVGLSRGATTAPIEVEILREADRKHVWAASIDGTRHLLRRVDGLRPRTRYAVLARARTADAFVLAPSYPRAFESRARGWDVALQSALKLSKRDASAAPGEVMRDLAMREYFRGMGFAELATPDHVPALLAVLEQAVSGGQADLVRAVIVALGQIRDPRALERLRTLLHTATHPAILTSALESVGRLVSPGAFDVLLEHWPRVTGSGMDRTFVAWQLVRADPGRAHALVRDLVSNFGSRSAREQLLACIVAQTLRRPDLVPAMVQIARGSSNEGLRGQAVGAIWGTAGPQGLSGLRELAAEWKGRAPPEGLLSDTIYSLGHIGGPRDVPLLAGFLAPSHPPGIRAMAARSMAEAVGAPPRERVGGAEGASGTEPAPPDEALAELESARAGAAARLRELLSDPDPWVVNRAVRGLGRLRDRSAVEPLIALLDRPGLRRGQVLRALALIGDARAVGPLLKLATSEPTREPGRSSGPRHPPTAVDRGDALWALARMRAAAAFDALVQGLGSPEVYVRLRAAEGLGLLGEGRAAKVLERTLPQADEKVVVKTVVKQALAWVRAGGAPASPFVILDQESGRMRSGVHLVPGDRVRLTCVGAFVEEPEATAIVGPSGVFFDLPWEAVVDVDGRTTMVSVEEREQAWLGESELLARLGDRGRPSAVSGFATVWIERQDIR